jgi:glyoxylase-like metal-dependent hydrolase (beta-lactamase superfamily II)
VAEVKVLIEGYAREIDKGWLASSTVTLIRAGTKKAIVDPGCNRAKLIEALNEEGLGTKDIDFVVLTHGHGDHTLLCGIFENAKVIYPEEMYNNDNQVSYEADVIGQGVEIIKTPGHCPEHCSVLVKTDKGTYAVAGDVFWCTEGGEVTWDVSQIDEAHPAEVDMKQLVKTRKMILKKADFVIPGHGKMFESK